jgi:hypothetical protein
MITVRHSQSERAGKAFQENREALIRFWCNADKGIYLHLKLGKRDRLNHRIFGQPQVTLIIWS